jgi:5-methylthioribose kinase
MSKFDHYFLMKEADVAEYIREKMPDYFARETKLAVKEIGDGNLNYVFRVTDESAATAGGTSIIVKQAGETLRISAEMKISTDRNRIESEILLLQDTYAPGLVPKIFQYDTVMCACVMEDLSSYQLMRYALMEHKTFPRFADEITTYMANTLLSTTDAVMEHKAKKALVKRFINSELCEITEDLVYTEPYNDVKGRNVVTPANAAFVKKELYDDTALHLEIAKLKFDFMNNAQSLIHGDLHTGSIFVRQTTGEGGASIRVFDPEFAFYGPMGYDIGNVIANLFFAWDNGDAASEVDAGSTGFCAWTLETAASVIDLFRSKFLRLYRERVSDVMAKTPGFAEYYLDTIIADTAACTGTELIRRTVGMAQVKDVTTIPDAAKRARAERVNILCAKDCIMRRASFKTGADFVAAFTRAVDAAKNRDS